MLTLLKSFSHDERGFIVSTELVLVATLCVLGLLTGLTCLRDAVNGELRDVAGAIGSLNQSYSYTGFHGCITPKCGVRAWTVGSSFGAVNSEAAIPLLEGGAVYEPAPAVYREQPECTVPTPVPQPTIPPCPLPAAIATENPTYQVVPEATVVPCPCEVTARQSDCDLCAPSATSAGPVLSRQPVRICPPVQSCPAAPGGEYLIW